MALTLATWNINSVRLRLDLVRRFIAEAQPDVLFLQETKSPDEHFPREAFTELGYTHQLVHGMKSYNGVAILSRLLSQARRRKAGAAARIAATPSQRCRAASSCTISMCRRAATFPMPRKIANSPTSSISSTPSPIGSCATATERTP
jgi:exonuclease III